MRILYTFLFYLLLPGLFLRLLWRSRRLASYRYRLRERLGFCPYQFNQSIWVHAVSVGEVLAALPLIKALKSYHPMLPILVTTMTPTGAERVQALLGDSVTHAYFPYDLPDAWSRFLKRVNPIQCIIIETEIWPNLFAACQKRDIPLYLVNARLSERSARGYQRIRRLTKTMFQSIKYIAAVGQVDADRFMALGADKMQVVVSGNIKFDLALPSDLENTGRVLRHALGENRFIWIAASTHEGEEEIVLEAHQKILETNPAALLILVPRHPDRFDSVAKLCVQKFNTARRSLQQTSAKEVPVYLCDTMGELMPHYYVADVVFMGGSLISRGGHNMLEPAALAKPLLIGPSFFNFLEISELFFKKEAMRIVTDATTLANEVISLMLDRVQAEAMGGRAETIIQENRGALEKQLAIVVS